MHIKEIRESQTDIYSHIAAANSYSIRIYSNQVVMHSLSYTLLGLLLLSAVLGPALGIWQLIPGSLKHVTASINYVWGVDNDNNIFKCVQPCNGILTQVAGKLKQIEAGLGGECKS